MEVNSVLLKDLESMGFETEQSKEALIATGNASIDKAVEWITSRKESTAKVEAATSSWKCVETGRIFKTMKDLELYAERTGRSNFEETTEKAKERTPEEIAKAKEALREKIKKKRLEREKAERKAQIEREKSRRAAGKFEGTMREEGMRLKRKRDAELRKKEKREAAKALAREKQRWALQQAEKDAEKAMKLGISVSELRKNRKEEPSKTRKKTNSHPLDRVKTALQVLKTYTAGGEGEKAIKLLRIYVRNVLQKSDENEKVLQINMGNKHFVNRVKPLKGGVSLLKAIGFVIHNDDPEFPDGVLKIPKPIDKKLLEEVIGAMQRALTSM
jgi:hypothetical protein